MHPGTRIASSACTVVGTLLLTQCYVLRGNSGGGRDAGASERVPDAAAVRVPDGYGIELVASGLTCPTGIAFDDANVPCVVESGFSPKGFRHVPRLVRLDAAGGRTVVAEGRTEDGPWNGVAFHDGAFLVAEGGMSKGGRILRIAPDGSTRALAENLPGFGDHSVNGPVVGPDGAIYFGIGTATNSGIVGADNAHFGWLSKHPEFCDIPGQDVVLTGRNFASDDVVGDRGNVQTGAFVPFGTTTTAGQRIPGRVPCTGAVLKLETGGRLALVAWGFRNPYGLAFAPDGRLFVTDNGYDERGSRPVWGSGELLWHVRPGVWYGWPDYAGDRPLTDDEFDPPAGDEPTFLLAEHPNVPPKPAAILDVHGSADGFDFSRDERFGHVGEAFVALFGDQTPTTGDLLAPAGFKVVRVDVTTGVVREFAANAGDSVAPASKHDGRGLERPIAARFDRTGTALYVVDFGVLVEGAEGSKPTPASGCVWRITRGAALPSAAMPAAEERR
jgi:glucose/arabinose dehydrogenase